MNYHFPSLSLTGKTLILGMGETGVAAAQWCLQQGAGELRLADTRVGLAASHNLKQRFPDRIELVEGDAALQPEVLEQVVRIVISPGLSPLQAGIRELLALAHTQSIQVMNEVELFALALRDLAGQGYTPKVIGITGTNGKTTVTQLTRHMLNACDRDVVVAGNISPATLSVLAQRMQAGSLPQVWVLELSSFQLHWLRSLEFHAATVLNLSQDHSDWHGSMEAYQADKARIYTSAQTWVVNRDDSNRAALVADFTSSNVRSFGLNTPLLGGDMGLQGVGPLQFLAYALAESLHAEAQRQPAHQIDNLLEVSSLRLHGQHNLSNALAALALAHSVCADWDALLSALSTYEGEPHRMQWLRSCQGVGYINDSKGTNVGATVAALTGLQQPVVLIAGGVGKGQDFTPLAEALNKTSVRGVVVLGQDAARIQQVLNAADFPVVKVATLTEAVTQAAELAQAGDVVLLSPACASLDMFANYQERGQCFAQCVEALALQAGEVV